MSGESRPEHARLLFRYLGGEEWRDYRAILAVFSNTFFAEFSPDEVVERLAGTSVDPGVVPDRLESLRAWGNLSASTSVGNPSSLDDYYRRRHRYLITRAGQEVNDLVEGVLQRVDEVGDVQAGRLRDLHRALARLSALVERGLEEVPASDVGDAVRGVFDPHESFATEITQFFASINQWQSRYDLEPDEIAFFAEVLVGYVSEQLVEIERMARPVAVRLHALWPHLDDVVAHARSGLAARADAAGFGDAVKVRAAAGTERVDWDHLVAWFGTGSGDGLAASRLDALTRQAVAAVRTLTGNLTRLSRSGVGSASRRADFVRLAGFIDAAPDAAAAHELASAAFGLHGARHFGTLSSDADDPVATMTPWRDAPRAPVPLTLRERGERTMRGSATPIRDRAMEREVVRRRREEGRAVEALVARELLGVAAADGRLLEAEVSVAALRRLRALLGASGARRRAGRSVREASDADLSCEVRRTPDAAVRIACPKAC